jgi:thiamine-phosphate pyrophosphorylase
VRERTRLYLVSPPDFDPEAFSGELKATLAAGDVAVFQLRLKNRSDTDVLEIAGRLAPIVQDSGVAFILNDRPDLALTCEADGVHIGQEDAPYEDARRILGPDRIVGVTCHASRHLAMTAAEAGADYVAFGAFYPTATKDAPARAEPALLTWWQETFEVPCVAIGGIAIAHADALARAGADFLAVSAGVWAHPEGPAAAVRLFNEALDRASGQ